MQGGRRGYPSHQKMGGTQEGSHLEERLNESGLHLENFRSTSKASIVFVCRVAFAFQLRMQTSQCLEQYLVDSTDNC